MSHFHCDTCGKVKQGHFHHNNHFDHHGHHDFHQHDHFKHHDNFHNCDCDKCRNLHRKDFICDRFICDDDFRLRLGGLQGNLNFRLRQLIGCPVKIELESGKKILAKICFVGSDFVEVEVLKEKREEEREDREDRDGNENREDRKDQRKRRNNRRKFNRDKALILRVDAIQFVELDDDCDCHDDIECNCHH
ncbi:hypothetical protein ACLM5H_01170 [Fredinandcohnia humi]